MKYTTAHSFIEKFKDKADNELEQIVTENRPVIEARIKRENKNVKYLWAAGVIVFSAIGIAELLGNRELVEKISYAGSLAFVAEGVMYASYYFGRCFTQNGRREMMHNAAKYLLEQRRNPDIE